MKSKFSIFKKCIMSLLVLAAMISTLSISSTQAASGTIYTPETLPEFLTGVNVTHSDGTQSLDGDTWKYYETMFMEFEFSVPKTMKSGDSFTFSFPSGLKSKQIDKVIPIYTYDTISGTKVNVANVTVKTVAGEEVVVIDFLESTDYLQNHDNITGSFSLMANFEDTFDGNVIDFHGNADLIISFIPQDPNSNNGSTNFGNYFTKGSFIIDEDVRIIAWDLKVDFSYSPQAAGQQFTSVTDPTFIDSMVDGGHGLIKYTEALDEKLKETGKSWIDDFGMSPTLLDKYIIRFNYRESVAYTFEYFFVEAQPLEYDDQGNVIKFKAVLEGTYDYNGVFADSNGQNRPEGSYSFLSATYFTQAIDYTKNEYRNLAEFIANDFPRTVGSLVDFSSSGNINGTIFKVQIGKVDQDQNLILGEATHFDLYREVNGNYVKLKEVVIGESGLLEMLLNKGNYYLEETKAPAGYELSTEREYFTIDDNSASYDTEIAFEDTLKIENKTLTRLEVNLEKTWIDNHDDEGLRPSMQEFMAGLKLYRSIDAADVKSDDESFLVPDEAYRLSGSELNDVYTIVSTQLAEKDKDGKTYYYWFNESLVVGYVQTGYTGNAMINERVKGAVILTKVDSVETDVTLDGAIFTLYKEDGSVVEAGLVTDNGVISKNNLTPGNYYFQEDVAPTNYEVSQEKYAFTIVENQSVAVEITATNNRILNKGDVVLVKTDNETGSVLAGVEFGLYQQDGVLIEGSIKSDAQGEIRRTLAEGSYYFQETKALDGYVLNDKKLEFTITRDTTSLIELSLENTRMTKEYSVELMKVDASDREVTLSGAVFNLYRENGTLIKENLVTNQAGMIEVDGLSEGSYYFLEIKAPTGYQLSDKKHTFTLESDQTEVVRIVVENVAVPSLPNTGVGMNQLSFYLVGVGALFLTFTFFINRKKEN